MKRISLVIVATLIMALVTTACGSDPTPTPKPKPTATPVPVATATPTGATKNTAAKPKPKATVAPKPKPKPTPTPRPSFDAAKYFKGQTIRMVVGLNPGGGTDTQARFYAGKWAKFIPGKPRIIVSNQTPQKAASNYVWASKPDGFTIQYTAGTQITDSFEPESKFVASEFSLIGAPQSGNPVWVVRGTLPYNDIKDAVGKPNGEKLVQTGGGSAPEIGGTGLATMLLADWLNLPMDYKVVAGTGTEQSLLMLERGDINAWTITPGSSWFTLPARRPGWFSKGYLKPFAGLLVPGQAIRPNAEIEFKATNGRDLLKPDQQAIFDALTPPDTIALKHLAGPPKMNPDVLATYRKAWDDAIADPKFNAGLAKVLGSKVADIPGAKLQTMYKATVDGYRKNLPTLTTLQKRLFSKYIE